MVRIVAFLAIVHNGQNSMIFLTTVHIWFKNAVWNDFPDHVTLVFSLDRKKTNDGWRRIALMKNLLRW